MLIPGEIVIIDGKPVTVEGPRRRPSDFPSPDHTTRRLSNGDLKNTLTGEVIEAPYSPQDERSPHDPGDGWFSHGVHGR